ncbi:DNA binding domain-containing protein, excisionase family [Ferrimonas sediminum]|uniref:DNA binding domain-containing protein, excisionase family n=1 Tax=Ferrimonas sediminum TaxID=718193 RepID=A0A1G8JGF3_9GAMM|nr:helix-turn-helix transcriptional regulator [Ferrimonas sediminum]SDI30364.1 DNA binding domain-containing protein, excisionase family [Ferrimonas sediminum]
MTTERDNLFMNAKEVAEYLDLNEKKVYAMANEQQLPGTKVTGKWLFPKPMIDRWVMESCHFGMLSDRLIITGSDDPLLQWVINRLGRRIESAGLVNYCSTGSRLGLNQLARGHADVCALHWGDEAERDLRHTALLKRHPQFKQWVMVHACSREYGIMLRSEHQHLCHDLNETLALRYRWVTRQEGAGARHHFDNWLTRMHRTSTDLNVTSTAYSEREMAGMIARGEAEFGMGCQGIAGEFGLAFVPLGKESFDLVMPQGVYFRYLLQQMFELMQTPDTLAFAQRLGGYDLSDCGRIIWSPS